ncbi:3-ketoacyl-CoA synthase 1 [Coccomyxa sp. Obi]|nr:3-ketoacyl-CoA synthase 1 [Coccomyxa sp. Obi]
MLYHSIVSSILAAKTMGRGGQGAVQWDRNAEVTNGMSGEDRSMLTDCGKRALNITCRYAVHFLLLTLAFLLRGPLLDAHRNATLHSAWQAAQEKLYTLPLMQAVALQAAVLAFTALCFNCMRPARKPTYLLGFYCLRPPNRLELSRAQFMDGCRRPNHACNDVLIEFSEKVLEISGLGDRTFVPDKVKRAAEGEDLGKSFAEAVDETETALMVSIKKVLHRTGLKPCQIDALIVNCSAFNPVPSLSARMVRHFKFRSDIRTVNLSGMGCAASIIAIDWARDMLAANPNKRVLIVGTENISWNIYKGKQRSMLITNCIFRYGGVAYVLSNIPADRRRAKYQLRHVVRTHLGSDDEAYNAVIQKEDDDGVVGVKIGKELMKVAGKALKVNITQLGQKVLPLSKQLIFAGNFIACKVLGLTLAPYMPDFKTAFDHFCIHPGGKAVISEVGSQLRLSREQCLPMLVPFERYGNTSSSSTWYAWSYVETFQGVKKGDRVWQLSFGSGFKCASAVWVSLCSNTEKHDAWTDTPSW